MIYMRFKNTVTMLNRTEQNRTEQNRTEQNRTISLNFSKINQSKKLLKFCPFLSDISTLITYRERRNPILL